MESDLDYICGQTYRYADERKNVMVSIENTSRELTYRQLCEDPAWNGLKGVQITILFYLPSESEVDFFHCKGHRPSQYFVKSGKCDGKYDCIDRSDETECVEGHSKYQKRRLDVPSKVKKMRLDVSSNVKR